MTNEEWRFLEPVEILETTPSASSTVHEPSGSSGTCHSASGPPPHFAIRLERKLERTIQTVFVPQFLIVSSK